MWIADERRIWNEGDGSRIEDIQRTVTPAALDKAALYQRRRWAFVTAMSDDGARI